MLIIFMECRAIGVVVLIEELARKYVEAGHQTISYCPLFKPLVRYPTLGNLDRSSEDHS